MIFNWVGYIFFVKYVRRATPPPWIWIAGVGRPQNFARWKYTTWAEETMYWLKWTETPIVATGTGICESRAQDNAFSFESNQSTRWCLFLWVQPKKIFCQKHMVHSKRRWNEYGRWIFILIRCGCKASTWAIKMKKYGAWCEKILCSTKCSHARNLSSLLTVLFIILITDGYFRFFSSSFKEWWEKLRENGATSCTNTIERTKQKKDMVLLYLRIRPPILANNCNCNSRDEILECILSVFKIEVFQPNANLLCLLLLYDIHSTLFGFRSDLATYYYIFKWVGNSLRWYYIKNLNYIVYFYNCTTTSPIIRNVVQLPNAIIPTSIFVRLVGK